MGYKTKQISIRIPQALYDQLKEHPQTNTSIIIKATQQYFRSSDQHNTKLDQNLIDLLMQQNQFLKQELQDWKKISIMNMSIWQYLKQKLLHRPELPETIKK